MTDLRERLQTTLGDNYILERELGGGGMSRVFVADETALGRKVVVKVLPPELVAGVSVGRVERTAVLHDAIRGGLQPARAADRRPHAERRSDRDPSGSGSRPGVRAR